MEIDEQVVADTVADIVLEAYLKGLRHGIALAAMCETMSHNNYNTGLGKHPISQFHPDLFEKLEPKIKHFIETGEWL